MNKEQRDRLPEIAKNLAVTKNPATRLEKNIFKIYQFLLDGNWHGSKEIADNVGRSPDYIQNIMPKLKEAWGLASSREGYAMPNQIGRKVDHCTRKKLLH